MDPRPLCESSTVMLLEENIKKYLHKCAVNIDVFGQKKALIIKGK